MFRNAVLVVFIWSFYSSVSFAVVDSDNEFRQQFTQAQNLAAQGQIAEAITAYQTLIHSNPVFPEAYNNLAALYLLQNSTKEAKRILEQGLHAHKGYGALYDSLTAINVALARKAYSKALQIDLKPLPINISSLSLLDSESQPKQNTKVIPKIDKPVIKEKKLSEEKVVPQTQTIKKTSEIKPAAKIQEENNLQLKAENIQPVEKVLQAWSAAWSAQAVDMYLSFYHKQYKPVSGLSRKGWVQSRRYRLKKPQWIKVGLSDFNIKKQSKTHAVVNFKQVYQSNTFTDVSYKQVVLLNTDDGWRIFREKNF